MSGKLLHLPVRNMLKVVTNPDNPRSSEHICLKHQKKFKIEGKLDANNPTKLCRVILCNEVGVVIPSPISQEKWEQMQRQSKHDR